MKTKLLEQLSSPRALLAFFISFVLILIGLEFFVRVYFYPDHSDIKNLQEKYKLDFKDNVVHQAHLCKISHPFLGFIYFKREGCDLSVNSIGMADARELPLRKDPKKYTILLEGGSVAYQLTDYHYLEQALNRGYFPPHGKEFVIFKGAFGAGAYPQQNNMTLLYGDRVDAVISIDGFNEAVYSQNPWQILGTPNPDHLISLVNTAALLSGNDSYSYLHLNIRSDLEFIKSNPLLKHSFLAFYVFEKIILRSKLKSIDQLASHPVAQAYLRNSAKSIPEEEVKNYNFSRYEHFVLSNYALAKSLGLNYLHFIQPIRWLYKNLTEKEKTYEKHIDVRYYQKMIDRVKHLNKQKIPSFSLARIFEKYSEEIYGDYIHFKHMGDYNLGYQIMANEIAQVVAKEWNLKKR